MSLAEHLENRDLFGDHPMFPRTPLREWIRKHIPAPSAGYVAEDLDLIFLRFGKIIGRDKNADGQFILCEWKLAWKPLPYSQQRVFGLMDKILRKGDPSGTYYQGFYYICWDGKTEPVWLNNNRVAIADFQAFLLGKKIIPPMLLSEVRGEKLASLPYRLAGDRLYCSRVRKETG